MTIKNNELDRLIVTTLRMLSIDQVQAANSGHPGMPLGAAAMAYALWEGHLKHNPANPLWPDRDRFILSAGHGSALIYSLLHMAGYDLTLDDLKNFRQWGAKTAGHPEYGLTPGVESTTGPLGQGFSMGVGMALAQTYLAETFNKQGFPIFDHYTYAIVSDGDLMEGVASEAASLAGTLGLGRLIYLYDDNHISIEGSTDLAFTEDVGKRFEAYGWHIQKIEDGDDLSTIDRAITEAKLVESKPSLIMVRTHIGYGSPRQDMAKSHGEPLGVENIDETRKFFNWPNESFHVPEETKAFSNKTLERGANAERMWETQIKDYKAKYPDMAEKLTAVLENRPLEGWLDALPAFKTEDGPIATRAASGKVLNAIAAKLPTMIGGSADLGPSNKTTLDGYGSFGTGENGSRTGRTIHFGVREHAMGAIINGMALHGGMIPYGGTFLIFSDYMRPAIRLAALMDVPSIFVFTHDSIALGEDGPTHQPVEQLASLRAIPNLTVIRPADANETAGAWKVAVESANPVALALSRQKLPVLNPEDFPDALPASEGVLKGAYSLTAVNRTPEVILIATGAEIHVAVEALKRLAVQGIVTRLVSMPSWELFIRQDKEYQNSVLPTEVKARIAVEAGSPMGWERWIGQDGIVIGVDKFGASAPAAIVLDKYGFNPDNIVRQAKGLVGR